MVEDLEELIYPSKFQVNQHAQVIGKVGGYIQTNDISTAQHKQFICTRALVHNTSIYKVPIMIKPILPGGFC
jgi:hypothetical protein